MSKEEFTSIHDCVVVDLPRIKDVNGSITPIYGQEHIPFNIARVYYLYDVPGGAYRGGHAHKNLQQLIVSVMGSFDVVLSDGRERKRVTLNRAYKGIYIPKLIWRELENFSSGANCLVLASLVYEEDDYLRDYNEYVKYKEEKHA